MKYEKTVGGYFYKVYNNGDRKRISKEVFDKSIKKGGANNDQTRKELIQQIKKYYSEISNLNEMTLEQLKELYEDARKEFIQEIEKHYEEFPNINKNNLNKMNLEQLKELYDKIIVTHNILLYYKNLNTEEISSICKNKFITMTYDKLKTLLSTVKLRHEIKKIYKKSGTIINKNKLSELYKMNNPELSNIIKKLKGEQSGENEKYVWYP
jgi:hypothetical protein